MNAVCYARVGIGLRINLLDTTASKPLQCGTSIPALETSNIREIAPLARAAFSRLWRQVS
jgi:hypothetical protein